MEWEEPWALDESCPKATGRGTCQGCVLTTHNSSWELLVPQRTNQAHDLAQLVQWPLKLRDLTPEFVLWEVGPWLIVKHTQSTHKWTYSHRAEIHDHRESQRTDTRLQRVTEQEHTQRELQSRDTWPQRASSLGVQWWTGSGTPEIHHLLGDKPANN
jgi:hypothetical protein